MKKLQLLLAGVFTFCIAPAQTSFGIFGGPQSTTARYTIDGTKQKTGYKYGYQGGICWDVPLEGSIHFTPALFYSLKGYNVTYNKPAYPPDLTATDNNVVLHTFEIATMLQFNLSEKPAHFFIKVGPSMDCQLLGTEKFHMVNGKMESRSVQFGFADYGRFGANLIGQLGYEINNGFFFFTQYNFGLGSINNADNGPRIYHRVMGFSIGKYIIRKKN
jgi:hypothetical protein